MCDMEDGYRNWKAANRPELERNMTPQEIDELLVTADLNPDSDLYDQIDEIFASMVRIAETPAPQQVSRWYTLSIIVLTLLFLTLAGATGYLIGSLLVWWMS